MLGIPSRLPFSSRTCRAHDNSSLHRPTRLRCDAASALEGHSGVLEMQVGLADIIKTHQHRRKHATEDDIEPLVELLKHDPRSLAPVSLYAIGETKYGLIGGHARVEAAKRAGLSTIKAIVGSAPRTEEEALLNCFTDNVSHGRSPTREERHDMIDTFFALFPQATNVEAARVCGVSLRTVCSHNARPKGGRTSTLSNSTPAKCQVRFVKAVQELREAGSAIEAFSPEFLDAIREVQRFRGDDAPLSTDALADELWQAWEAICERLDQGNDAIPEAFLNVIGEASEIALKLQK